MNFVGRLEFRSSELLQIKREFEGFNLYHQIVNKRLR